VRWKGYAARMGDKRNATTFPVGKLMRRYNLKKWQYFTVPKSRGISWLSEQM